MWVNNLVATRETMVFLKEVREILLDHSFNNISIFHPTISTISKHGNFSFPSSNDRAKMKIPSVSFSMCYPACWVFKLALLPNCIAYPQQFRFVMKTSLKETAVRKL